MSGPFLAVNFKILTTIQINVFTSRFRHWSGDYLLLAHQVRLFHLLALSFNQKCALPLLRINGTVSIFPIYQSCSGVNLFIMYCQTKPTPKQPRTVESAVANSSVGDSKFSHPPKKNLYKYSQLLPSRVTSFKHLFS